MPRVNLVPQEEQAREFRRQMYIFPVAGAVLVLAALGGTYYYYSSQVDNSQQEYANLQKTNASLGKQMQELQQYQDIQNQKQAKLNSVKTVYDQRVRWSRILDDISFVIPSDIWLSSLNASVNGTPVTAGGTTPKAGAGSTPSAPDITIEGYTDKAAMPSVATFLIRLGLLPSLQNVTLISADTEKLGTSLAIHFRIGAFLKQNGQAPAMPGPATVTPLPSTPAAGTTSTPGATPTTSANPGGAAGPAITTPTSPGGGIAP